MPRYFIEIAYKGTHFKGFQIQQNAHTIQGEINTALATILKTEIETTTSSRTDSGVHALQNYLHFDTEIQLPHSIVYNLNAVLPPDIVIKKIRKVNNTAHSRFDAIERKYAYHIIRNKNPFLKEIAYYFPFSVDVKKMNEAALHLLQHKQFESFSKKNTDVKTYNCNISLACFETKEEEIIFHIRANRFLRGMVRGITGTLLQVGRGKLSVDEFEQVILSHDCNQADFSTPAHGLFLEQVIYPDSIFAD